MNPIRTPATEEEVVGERVNEKEEGGLKHEGQTFHDEVEVLGDHPVHLALPMATAIGNGSAHLDLSVTNVPLLAQHGDGRGEEGSGRAGVEDGLDVDDSGIGAGLLRDSVVFAGEDLP